jgi:AcrR family transcriptional regulator
MGDSDVDKTLRLLWRGTLGTPQGRRGPRQRVSVDDVVRAGVAVADEEGLPAFSLRKVADRLGLKLMSLYTYVPGRDELIGLMVDEVTGEEPLPAHAPALRERLEAIAVRLWELYHRHPWLLQVENSRPWIGPHGSDLYEWQLSGIDGAGFTDIDMDLVVTVLSNYTAGSARASIAARRTAAASGLTDAGWWEVNAPILATLMPASRYPVSARVGTASGLEFNGLTPPEHAFRFGLNHLLSGLATDSPGE